MGKQCDLYPLLPNGEVSKLYKDLLTMLKNRPLANLIYAAYLQQGVAAKMNSQGYKPNKQGQHDAMAVRQFFNVDAMKLEAMRLKTVERRIGSRDSAGNLVDFTDSKDALQRAERANSASEGTVSYVVSHGDKFNIITEAKDSRTQYRKFDVEKNLAMWGVVEQVFNSIGIDVNSFDFNRQLVNATNSRRFVQWLNSLGSVRNDLLAQKEVETILHLDENSTQVQRLKQMFGSITDAANAIYDAYHGGRANYTANQFNLMESALNLCKNVQGLDIAGLSSQVLQVESNLAATSPEVEIQATLQSLNKKYNIDVNEIHRRVGEPIRQLSHAAADAVITMERQLRKLKSEQGITQETRRLEAEINNLLREISNKKYYSGVLGFLSEATNQVREMEKLLLDAEQASGTVLERSKVKSAALLEVDRIHSGYLHILKALSKIDGLIVDESISDTDKAKIKQEADAVLEYFDKYENIIRDLKEDTMLDIATEYLGDSTANGMAIADIVRMSMADSTWCDYMYSISRVSNPLLGTMGNIIRTAQGERTKKLADATIRISRANKKLRAAGKNSSFMYEPNSNYIISDLDWVAFNKAKYAHRANLIKGKLTGLSLEEAMEQWVEANTEERVVDHASGRTERVPSASYRKAFPALSAAEMEYYKEMMQLKGELGTLLPKYAQHQYLPPQKRRSFLDAVAASKGNPKKIAKAILTKMKDLVVVREDDMTNAQNGIIEGEEYGIKSGTLDNTPYRQIPIFFVNRLRDQGELLKDFSGALQALAGTAINYSCMNEIKDIVEFMGDFIKDQKLSETKRDKPQTDMVETKGIRVFKDLISYAGHTNTVSLVNGFLEKHLYGVNLKSVNKYTQLLKTLIGYTSLRSLAVNVKGMISNYLVGELQMLIEAGAGEFYGLADYAWAHGVVFGDNTIKAPGRIMDFLTNNVNSKSVLLARRFDPLVDEFGEMSNKRYYGPLRHLLSADFSFMGYGAGEHLIHFVNMYAVLHNIRVKIDGKDARLYDAFEVGNKVDGNSELIIKNNVEYQDDEGNWVAVDEKYLDKIRDRIRYCNQTTHGSMNEEDKGLIHRHMVGRFVANLRQWMVEHYSRRFRSSHYDASLGEYREGYYNTVGKFMLSWANDLFRFESKAALHWKDMTRAQKANVRRALAEQIVLACLLSLSFALGEPEDHKKEFWTRMFIYQTRRAIMDVRGSTPYGVPMELTKMINSPMAATSTVNALLYPFVGLSDLNETIRSGRYRGWNKYGKNIVKYWLPFYNQIDQLMRMDEDESVFAVFNNNMR